MSVVAILNSCTEKIVYCIVNTEKVAKVTEGESIKLR